MKSVTHLLDEYTPLLERLGTSYYAVLVNYARRKQRTLAEVGGGSRY
jgi:hypothetical protein